MAFCSASNHRGNFTQIPNDSMMNLLRKNKVKAFALYAYMASKPDYWVFRTSWIAKDLGWSEKAISRAMTSLEEEGYLKRTRKKTADGKYYDMHYDLYYTSQEPEYIETIPDHIVIPADFFNLCENPMTLEYVQYALSILGETDQQFMIQLKEISISAYHQIILKTITTVDSHLAINPEGYAITVLNNEIKRAKRTYTVLTKETICPQTEKRN